MRGIIEYMHDNIIVLSLLIIIAVPLLVFWYAGKYRMFTKGKEAGWQAIVPIYDYYVLTQLTDTNWWWFLIASLPLIYGIPGGRTFLLHCYLISLIGKFVIHYNLVKKFRKNDLFALAMSLLPLPFYCYLGLSGAKINNRVKITPNGPFDDYKEEIIEEDKKEIKPKKVKATIPVVEKKEVVLETTIEDIKPEVKEEVKTEVKKHVKKRATATKKEAIKKEKEIAKLKKTTTKPVKKADPTLKKKYARKLEQARLEKEEIKKANIKKNTKKKVNKTKKNK